MKYFLKRSFGFYNCSTRLGRAHFTCKRGVLEYELSCLYQLEGSLILARDSGKAILVKKLLRLSDSK